MKVSIIIAVYKDIEALDVIFKSLTFQTYTNFEAVVAEDGNNLEMKEFISNSIAKYNFDIVHTTQEDIGVRKSKSQNNGINASTGEYLIFIDGDCILYSNFIQNHILLSGEFNIISGRRVNVGAIYSKKLRTQEIDSLWLEKNFFWKYLDIAKDAKLEKHTEEGFQIKTNGIIHTLIKKFRKKELALLGCNFSCHKEAMIKINGFDEELGNAAVASDTDLAWRFKGLGYKIISARYIANQFHLYHKRNPADYERGSVEKMADNQKNKIYRCKNGLSKQ